VPESKVSVFPAGLDASKVPAKATEQRHSTYRLAARDFRHWTSVSMQPDRSRPTKQSVSPKII